MEWLEAILNNIKSFKGHVPHGYIQIPKDVTTNETSFLNFLIEVFRREENAIKRQEDRGGYITDSYENNVITFAKQVINSLIPEYEKFDNSSFLLIDLLSQKHMAVSLYLAIENNLIKSKKIIENEVYYQKTYLGVVKFYNEFYGTFFDNQNAIKILCKYYKQVNEMVDYHDDIASSIYNHITSAGTPTDKGFAYNGIKMIEEYINKLPIDLIDKILKKYELYKVINDKTYRNQIYSIINFSSLTKKQKFTYKFSYLDSLFIANIMNNYLYKKYSEIIPEKYDRYFLDPFLKLSEDRIRVLKHPTTKELNGYWSNKCSTTRTFTLSEENIIIISLDIEKNKIKIQDLDSFNNRFTLKFNYTDWIIDQYYFKEFEEKIYELIFKNHSEGIAFNHRPLTFSLVYLNKYRGFNEQLIDFNNKFTYQENKFSISSQELNSNELSFYGNKIHSFSCIVGKNGSGKTTIIDFLRNSFLKFMNLISERKIQVEQDFLEKKVYEKYEILDSECEFLVIFQLEKEFYYLTNLENHEVVGAIPFDASVIQSTTEISKIAYFSNMLSTHQDNLLFDDLIVLKKTSEQSLSKSLNNFNQVDLSEAEKFLRIRQLRDQTINRIDHEIEKTLNKDLCYQLCFLDYFTNNLTEKQKRSFFDYPLEKNLILKSTSLNVEKKLPEKISLNNLISEYSDNGIEIITTIDLKIKNFSSGQYAKFSFLSRLYWFLKGYQRHSKYLNSIVSTFGQNEGLTEGESALLFVDEGELYYHPEWQRNFVKNIIDMVHLVDTNSKVQLVVTTNSPFIISDILNKDITYLCSQGKNKLEQTFGQNIHKLLRDNFFMEYTIGEYSRNMIKQIIEWLNSYDVETLNEGLKTYFNGEVREEHHFSYLFILINKIGEPVYRRKLLEELEKLDLKKKNPKDTLKKEILKQKAELERILKEIDEGEENDKT